MSRLDSFLAPHSTLLSLSAVFLALGGCASMPTPKHDRFTFPKKDAFKKEPDRPYIPMGYVRTKVSWPSMLQPDHEDKALCDNYYNKAVRDLVKMAREHGGNAVADIHSVVFLYDGRRETYPTPECSDDGEEGQILLQGIAIKWATAEEARKAKEARDAARAAEAAAKATPSPGAPGATPTSTYVPGQSYFYEQGDPGGGSGAYQQTAPVPAPQATPERAIDGPPVSAPAAAPGR